MKEFDKKKKERLDVFENGSVIRYNKRSIRTLLFVTETAAFQGINVLLDKFRSAG